jgi:Mrp family chromosome partitioning ATPase
MRFAKNALSAVRTRGAQLVGLVLNGITSDNPNYYYQNYYHNYYSHEQPKQVTLAAAPLPAVQMPPPKAKAAPRTRAPRLGSIEAEAKARVGKKLSMEDLAAIEQFKAEKFRNRNLKPKV